MRTSAVWWRLCAVSAVAAVLTALVLALGQPKTAAPDTTATPTGADVTAESRAPEPLAYVGEWEGKLAVFRTENAPPDEVYDVFIASLPAAEQAALAAGIPVFDEVALQKLLEDYTG